MSGKSGWPKSAVTMEGGIRLVDDGKGLNKEDQYFFFLFLFIFFSFFFFFFFSSAK